jgi:MFS family permease
MMGARGVSAFAHRNYRLFFAGQAVSLVGTWMQQVAQAWLVLQLTHDPFWLGVVAAAQFIPVMILGLFAGVLADTLPKRQTLIAVQAVMMTLAAILAVLTATGLVTVPIILLLALLLGCANAVDMPVRQSFAVEMVGRDDIGSAVALNSAMFNGARIVGPAVAGLTIGLVGVAAAFAINAISFLAVIIGLLAMRDSELRSSPLIERPRSVGAVVEHLREGYDYVRGTPLVLLAVLVVGLVSTFGMNFGVVIPTLTQEQLLSDAAGYGFLMAASGVGSLAAALWLAFGGAPRPSRMAWGAMLLGVGEVLLAISHSYPLSLLLMVGVGFGAIAMAATANTTLQLASPDRLRGRVMSFYTTIFAGSTPIGGLLMGGIASAAGIAISMAVGGLLSLAIGVGAFVWTRRRGLDRPIRPTTAAGLAAANAPAGAAPSLPGAAVAATSATGSFPEAVRRR